MTNFKVIILCLIIFSSCSTKKNIVYFQGLDSKNLSNIEYQGYRVMPDDILKISVGAENPEATVVFNKNSSLELMSNSRETMELNGYQLSLDGYIHFPNLGKIKLLNMTIPEIRDFIYSEIVKKGVLLDPSVDVKLINAHFTILGEVNSPGRYEFLKNNINILEAIGVAGDLTINAERKDVRLIRNSQGKRQVYNIDLTNKKFILENTFQIFSGDIIVVNPNYTRVKNAGIIGNSGTLLSLLSFILSSIIVINN